MEEGVSPSLSRNGFSFSCELAFSGSLSESVSFFGGSNFPDARDYFFFGGSRVPYLTGDGVFVPKWSDVAPFADPQETASEGVFSAGSKVGSWGLFSCICSGLEELDIHFTSVDPVPYTRGLECLGGRNKTDRVTETFLWVSDLAFGDFPEPEPVDCGGSRLDVGAPTTPLIKLTDGFGLPTSSVGVCLDPLGSIMAMPTESSGDPMSMSMPSYGSSVFGSDSGSLDPVDGGDGCRFRCCKLSASAMESFRMVVVLITPEKGLSGKAIAAQQSWPAIVDRPEIYGLDAKSDDPFMHDDGFSIFRSWESGVAGLVHFVNGCSRQFVDIWFPSGGQLRLVPLRVSVQVIECSGRFRLQM